MDYLFIIPALFFAGITTWLWLLRRTQTVHIKLDTIFSSNQDEKLPNSQPFFSLDRLIYLSNLASLIAAFLLSVGLVSATAGLTTAPGTNPLYLEVIHKIFVVMYFVAGISFILLLITLIAHFILRFLKTRQAERRIHLQHVVPLVAKYMRIHYRGQLIYPKKIYVGNSENIDMSLDKGHLTASSPSQDTQRKELLEIYIPKSRGVTEQHLEAELLAAALVVAGEAQQRKTLGEKHLHYHWNCFFPNSGIHVFTLTLRAITPVQKIELASIERTVKVTKLVGLTQQQVGILQGIAGLAAFILSVVSVISLLHLFGLH
ncbi:MAG TPA: hypothetical protein VFV38_22145 [Ktedonobacteraceae bacterium]|nr:hypothetical protein [Ktedonobacteraceae bacterium]